MYTNLFFSYEDFSSQIPRKVQIITNHDTNPSEGCLVLPANLMVLVQAKQDTVWSLLATNSGDTGPRQNIEDLWSTRGPAVQFMKSGEEARLLWVRFTDLFTDLATCFSSPFSM